MGFDVFLIIVAFNSSLVFRRFVPLSVAVSAATPFLDAPSHLYKRLCPSVRP